MAKSTEQSPSAQSQKAAAHKVREVNNKEEEMELRSKQETLNWLGRKARKRKRRVRSGSVQ